MNALLGTLGPSGGGARPATPLGEAMGGTVGSICLDDSYEGGEDEEGAAESAKRPTIQLQRVAPRCHCQVIYVTYGDQVEAEITRSASPGSVSVSTQVVCVFVSVCTSVSVVVCSIAKFPGIVLSYFFLCYSSVIL